MSTIDLSALLAPYDSDTLHTVTVFPENSLSKRANGVRNSSTLAEIYDWLLAKSQLPAARYKDDIEFIMPADSSTGSHKAGDVTSHSALIWLDCDDGDGLALVDTLTAAGIASLWMETPTSCAAKPKCRVVIPVSRHFTGPDMVSDHYKCYTVCLRIAQQYDQTGEYDLKVGDLSRIFFTPRRCIWGKKISVKKPDGVPSADPHTPRSVIYTPGTHCLDVDALLALHATLPAMPAPPVSQGARGTGNPKAKSGLKTVLVVPDDTIITTRHPITKELSTRRLDSIQSGEHWWVLATCHASEGTGGAFAKLWDGHAVVQCDTCGITTYTQSGSDLYRWKRANQQAAAKAAKAAQTPALPPQATPEEQARHEALLALAADPKYAPLLASMRGHKAGQDLLDTVKLISQLAKTQAKNLRKLLPKSGIRCCIAATQIDGTSLQPSLRRMACTTRDCEVHGAYNILRAYHSAWRLPVWHLDPQPASCDPQPDIATLPPALIEKAALYAVRVRPDAVGYIYSVLTRAQAAESELTVDWTEDGPKIVRVTRPATQARLSFTLPDGDHLILSTTNFDASRGMLDATGGPSTTPDTSGIPDGTLPDELLTTCKAIQLTGAEAFRLIGPHMLRFMHPEDTGIEMLAGKQTYISPLPRHSQTVTLAITNLTKLLPKTKMTAAMVFGHDKIEALTKIIHDRQGDGVKAEDIRTAPPSNSPAKDEFDTSEELPPEQADSKGTHWLSTEVRQPATPAILDHRFALAGTKKLRANLDALVAPDLDAVHAAIDNL